VRDLWAAMMAECLRLRRTLALTVTLAAPIFVGVIVLIIGTRRREPLAADASGWLGVFQQVWTLWALMMLPMVITAMTALAAQVEHQASAWKQLYATPTARWAVYASKLLAASALALVSSVVAALAVVGAGLALRVIRPETHPLPLSWPAGEIAQMVALPWLASLALVAGHLWVAVRFRSFAVAVSAGILGTFSALAFMGAAEGFWWPWLWPAYALPSVQPGEQAGWVLSPAVSGVLAWAALGALGCWRCVRRDAG